MRVKFGSGAATLSTTPLPAEPDPFRSLLPRLCLVGALTHVAFLVVFSIMAVPVLVAVNIASVACYAAVFALVRRNRTNQVIEFGLVAVEVFAHAVIASVVLGWDSGFHYYILLLVPVTAVSGIRPAWLKLTALAAAALGYVGLDVWLRPSTQPGNLPGWTLECLYYFNVLSALLILALLATRYYMLINQTQAALQMMATTDALTGLHNRKSLTEQLEHHHPRADHHHPLSFIMCDIDHFKQVNDVGGHAAGDAVLKMVSQSMAASVRENDLLGRWGGEEFLVVLPDSDAAAAAVVAERLRANVATMPVLIDGRPSCITVTVGVATVAPGETATHTIARADNALYDGKRSGRNQVVTARLSFIPDTVTPTAT